MVVINNKVSLLDSNVKKYPEAKIGVVLKWCTANTVNLGHQWKDLLDTYPTPQKGIINTVIPLFSSSIETYAAEWRFGAKLKCSIMEGITRKPNPKGPSHTGL